MPEDRSTRGNPFHRLWQFVTRQIIGDAPDAIALCEFDCRKGQCMQDEWDVCDRRISKGAGELFPKSGRPKPPGHTSC
jgi:hypothetical protein